MPLLWLVIYIIQICLFIFLRFCWQLHVYYLKVVFLWYFLGVGNLTQIVKRSISYSVIVHRPSFRGYKGSTCTKRPRWQESIDQDPHTVLWSKENTREGGRSFFSAARTDWPLCYIGRLLWILSFSFLLRFLLYCGQQHKKLLGVWIAAKNAWWQ